MLTTSHHLLQPSAITDRLADGECNISQWKLVSSAPMCFFFKKRGHYWQTPAKMICTSTCTDPYCHVLVIPDAYGSNRNLELDSMSSKRELDHACRHRDFLDITPCNLITRTIFKSLLPTVADFMTLSAAVVIIRPRKGHTPFLPGAHPPA